MPLPPYPIETERLLLRPYGAADIDDLFAMHSREDVVRYLYWDVRDRDQVAAMLERRMTMTTLDKEGDALILTVLMRCPERSGVEHGPS